MAIVPSMSRQRGTRDGGYQKDGAKAIDRWKDDFMGEKRFPTLADFRAKRKMMRQGRHFVGRDETIGSREHSNIRKDHWL